MKILQVASFNGNIGDYANHMGFRRELKKWIGDAEFDNLEMRYFYQSWNKCKFDEAFAKMANQYDLLVFGGGGFFELKWDYSATGTTIDISKEILDLIETPILFNCIGTSTAKGASEQSIQKFGCFLDQVIEKGSFVTVRNDGSYELINELYHNKYGGKILKVPDGGFFCIPEEQEQPLIVKNYTNICINIAGDMPEIRFPGGEKLNQEEFVKEMADFCNALLEQDEKIRLIFVPHIMSDLKIISQVMERITDMYLRIRVTCSGCYNGEATNGLFNFDLYRNSNLVIGMRYHANVVPIGMNVPTIMMGTYPPHVSLYEDIGMMHRCVQANEKGFSVQLKHKVSDILQNKTAVCRENQVTKCRLQKENDFYMEQLAKWLKSCAKVQESITWN